MVPMTTPLHPSNYLSFYRVPLLVTAATTPLSPQIPTLPFIFQEASPPTSGASLAPPPALLTGPQYTLSPFVAFHPAPVLPQRIPSGPCLLPTFCRTTLSCPHTGVCHKVLVREELKISPGSRENPGPDQASKALPSGLGGKGGGLGEEMGSVSHGRWDDTGQGWVCEDREQPWEDPGQRECEDGPNCCPHGLWHLARLCSTGVGQRSLLSAFSGPECLC